MKILNFASSKTGTIPLKAIAVGWLLLSLVGFVDAAYLTIEHFRGDGLVCGPFWDCDVVTTSKYSEIGGIPLALSGALYYLVIFLLTVAYFDTKKDRLLLIIAPLTVFGFLASLFLVYLQVFVIHALCFYCMISALTSTGLFAFAVIYIRKRSQANNTDQGV